MLLHSDGLLLFNISNFGWPLFGFSPRHLCQKGQFSRGMPAWAKNAENVEGPLRLDRGAQGVRVESVAVTASCSEWKEDGRLRHIQHVHTRSSIASLRAEHDAVMQSHTLTDPSPPPLAVSVSFGLPKSSWLMAAGQTFWRRIQR